MKRDCVSCLVREMGACVTKQHEVIHPECFICNHGMHQHINLSCGHNIHDKCLVNWWAHQPDCGLRCPLCRKASYDCFLEISQQDKSPIGFYRHDNDRSSPIVWRKKEVNMPTTIVRILDDAKDLAFEGVLYILCKNAITANGTPEQTPA
jgi:hypothetical protein